jgi:hypothetical protein
MNGVLAVRLTRPVPQPDTTPGTTGHRRRNGVTERTITRNNDKGPGR